MTQQPINWRRRAREFAEQEDGPTASEYSILLAMLVLGSMVVIRSIGESFRGIYLAIAGTLPDA